MTCMNGRVMSEWIERLHAWVDRVRLYARIPHIEHFVRVLDALTHQHGFGPTVVSDQFAHFREKAMFFFLVLDGF